MLSFIKVMVIGFLESTIDFRKNQRTVTQKLEVGHQKFTVKGENGRFPYITEKERELY